MTSPMSVDELRMLIEAMRTGEAARRNSIVGSKRCCDVMPTFVATMSAICGFVPICNRSFLPRTRESWSRY